MSENRCNIHVFRHDNLVRGTITIEAIKQVLGCTTYLALSEVSKGGVIVGGMPETEATKCLRDLNAAWEAITIRYCQTPSRISPFCMIFEDEV